ncbi:MAG: hypothetical protein ACREKH_16005, partial [Candidatus Rokuibacteriota bacterium]
MKRIFVSYSASKDEASAFVRDVCQAIDDARDEQDAALFLAVVDTKLPEGFWRPVLYNWMVLCDAAVILIDGDSPESLWLPREAMVFRARKEIDPSFPIIPVLRGVDKTIFDTPAFKELGLGDLQYSENASPETIVAKLRQLVTSSAIPRELTQLEGLLKWAPEDSGRFDDARALLDFSERTWFSTFAPEREIAARLIGYGFRRGPFAAAGENYPGARALSAMKARALPADRLALITELLSAYWVDRAAGASLYLRLRHGRELVALRMHVDREGWPEGLCADYLQQASTHRRSRFRRVALSPVDPHAGTGESLEESRQRVYAALWNQIMLRAGEPNDT